MDWFDEPVELDAAQAALIAEGMRAVAGADGLLHERELALIASFEAELPEPADAGQAVLGSELLQRTFVRSLIMVALADGTLGTREREVIRELAAAQEIGDAVIDACVIEVKQRFLKVFAGVDVFRDSVVQVALDLGLAESEVDALRQEA
ncbi:MAG TPA: hypothetical protein ENK18_26695 [Deltaproteobacteria bacterium]|nr:hypothetical protein [Deltaproteobacteria bacterium]